MHEPGGSKSFSLTYFAQEVSDATGKSVNHQDLPEEDFSHLFMGAGVPEAFAEIPANSDRGIARGELLVGGNALETLLGRPAPTLREAVHTATAALAPQQA
ncbi:hypothetical protein ACFY5D_10765 [Paeniglutamicibacter sp. NPDC012692]|uniref:hypothetical protein n=1 Tax=Paeniglutamicibacter sp. NPDC012692 TaxID=3364388 RepID=UPI0036A8B6AF